MDLSGGLNTKRDAHAIERNQLAVSQNGWLSAENAVSKRPGSAPFVTATGAWFGGAVPPANQAGIVASRWGSPAVTTIVAQNGLKASFGTVGVTTVTAISAGTSFMGTGAGTIQTAQMYDPDASTPGTQLFIVNGVDVPWIWNGPVSGGGTNAIASVSTAAGFLPKQVNGSTPIKPKFITTVNGHMVYACDPTWPSGVWISDPFYPQRFNYSASLTSPFGASVYAPYTIGQNDGVYGGDITGISRLYGSIIVFKQSAIYRLDNTTLFGDIGWAQSVVSASVGCVAPESVVGFDSFIVFLGLDGVYTTDGQSSTQISRNVPTFFDSSLSGMPATCRSKTTAQAVRSGSRYIIFYDATGIGYANRGLWFDFAKTDKDGFPACGEIVGTTATPYNVGNIAALSGPGDDGNWVWTSASNDQIAKFGIGYTDCGPGVTAGAISVTLAGRADLMADVFGPKANVAQKEIRNIWLTEALVPQSTKTSVQFNVSVISDLLINVRSQPPPNSVAVGGGQWGQNWGAVAGGGTMVWSGSMGTQLQTSRAQGLQTWVGRSLQVQINEASSLPWTLLGYTCEVSPREISY
jgi:hypothetical protein